MDGNYLADNPSKGIKRYSEISSAAGVAGSDIISNTNERTGEWSSITAIANATFTKLVGNHHINGAAAEGTNFGGLTLLAGQTIYGVFTSIQLAGGSIQAMRTGHGTHAPDPE